MKRLALVFLAACSGEAPDQPGDQPDAQQLVDAGQLPVGCDYAERDDAGNDDVTEDGTPELTGETLTASAPVVLCGTVADDHWNAADDTVDVDGYVVQLPAGPVFLTLSGAGLEALGAAKLGVYGGADFTEIAAEEPLVGSHAAVMLDLPAGAYELALLAENGAAITQPIAYKIAVAVDTPATRCPTLTTAATYTEGTAANDVVAISYNPSTQTLTPAADAPDVTGITLQTTARISGVIAATGTSGAYKDPDTYSFTTGPSVDSLTVRLTWAGAADLDWYLFRADVPSVAASANEADVADEVRTVAVLPNTTYWLWTGMYQTSTAPKPYDLSLCGATFTPP